MGCSSNLGRCAAETPSFNKHQQTSGSATRLWTVFWRCLEDGYDGFTGSPWIHDFGPHQELLLLLHKAREDPELGNGPSTLKLPVPTPMWPGVSDMGNVWVGKPWDKNIGKKPWVKSWEHVTQWEAYGETILKYIGNLWENGWLQ